MTASTAFIRPLLGAGLFAVCGAGVLMLAPAPYPPYPPLLSLLVLGLLATLVFYDLKSHRLPNMITLPLAACGVVHSVYSQTITPAASVAGLVLGYGIIAGLRAFYLRRRGLEAIGLGDAKLCAAIGAWFGWTALPQGLLISAVTALLTTFIIMAFSALQQKSIRFESTQKIPFGPYLAVTFWLFWALGADNLSLFFRLSS